MDRTVIQFTAELEERSKPIDTIQLQLQSLNRLMEGLGYSLRRGFRRGYRADKIEGYKKVSDKVDGPNFLSFEDAVHLHNHCLWKVIGDRRSPATTRYDISGDNTVIKDAFKKRLVRKVKLQRLKKAPYLKVQNHYVELISKGETL